MNTIPQKSFSYRLLRAVLRALCQLLFRVEVENRNKEIPQERLLVIANHQSFLDGLLLGLFLPLDPVFVINTAIARQRMFRFLLLFVDHVTVDTANPMAMKRVIMPHNGLCRADAADSAKVSVHRRGYRHNPAPVDST